MNNAITLAGLCLIISMVCPTNSIAAVEDNDLGINTVSNEKGKWSFGLQGAPLTFGLSVKYALSPNWAVQGVLTPESDDAGVLLRILRRTAQSRYWNSYLFAGFAEGESDIFLSDEEGTVASLGLGVEWSWQAKNSNHPPLFWSFELGLGYRDQKGDERDVFFSEDDGLFLALGWGLHYNFK